MRSFLSESKLVERPRPLRRTLAALLAAAPMIVHAQPKLPPPPLALVTLTVSKAGSGIGTVTSQAGGIACGSNCSGGYTFGVPVVLTAKNGTGLFTGWSGTCTGAKTTCSLVMDATKSVTARFERPKLVVELAQEVKDATVTSTPAGISCGSRCGEYFDAGTTVSLFTHNQPAGYFTSFESGGSSVTMDKPVVIRRLKGVPSLRVLVSGPGSVSSQPAGIVATSASPGSFPFPVGNTVLLRVATGTVVSWNCDSGSQENCRQAGSRECRVVLSISAPTTCGATFR